MTRNRITSERSDTKDTRLWCRGVEGRSHVTEITVPPHAPAGQCHLRPIDSTNPFDWEIGCRHVERCAECGKHTRTFLTLGECPNRTAC